MLTSSVDLQGLSESAFFAEVERIRQWRIKHKDESSFQQTYIEETVWSGLMAEVSRRSHSKDQRLHGSVDLRPYSKPPEDEQSVQEIDEATRAQPPLSAPTIEPSRTTVRLLTGGTLPSPGSDSGSQTTASADELIAKYSIPDSLTGSIYTDKLGTDLSNLAAQSGDQNYKTVQDTFDKLDSTDKDDVALAMTSQVSDDQLELMIQNPNGRKLLHRLFDELTSGKLGEDEMAQANRILAVEQDTNLSTQTTEGKQRTAKDALVLPYRPPGFTVLTPSPIHAERLENGKIRVRLRSDLYGTDYRKDIFEHKIPGSVYSSQGVELNANQLVGVKLYDQGGKVVYVPALSLLTFNNQDTAKSYQMMAEAGITGLTLGIGGGVGAVGEGAEVVEGATQASRGLQLAKNSVRGLDIAATYGTPALTVAQEHRGEIINALGEYDGKLVNDAVDTAQTGLLGYGVLRTGVGIGKRALGKLRSSAPPSSPEPKSSNLNRSKQSPKVSDEILDGQPAKDFTLEAAKDNAIHPDKPASNVVDLQAVREAQQVQVAEQDVAQATSRDILIKDLQKSEFGFLYESEIANDVRRAASGEATIASRSGRRNPGSTNPPVRSAPPPNQSTVGSSRSGGGFGKSGVGTKGDQVAASVTSKTPATADVSGTAQASPSKTPVESPPKASVTSEHKSKSTKEVIDDFKRAKEEHILNEGNIREQLEELKKDFEKLKRRQDQSSSSKGIQERKNLEESIRKKDEAIYKKRNELNRVRVEKEALNKEIEKARRQLEYQPEKYGVPKTPQEFGHVQEKVIADQKRFTKNTIEFDTSATFPKKVEPDYLPKEYDPVRREWIPVKPIYDPVKREWIPANINEAVFVGDSKAYFSQEITLSPQIEGFIEIASKSKQKLLVLYTNKTAKINIKVFEEATEKGVKIMQVKPYRVDLIPRL